VEDKIYIVGGVGVAFAVIEVRLDDRTFLYGQWHLYKGDNSLSLVTSVAGVGEQDGGITWDNMHVGANSRLW